MKKLTEKQRLFCQYMLICESAAEAARKAGFSEKGAAQQANKLLNDPSYKHVQDYLAEMESEETTPLDTRDAGWLLQEALRQYDIVSNDFTYSRSSKTGKPMKDADGRHIMKRDHAFMMKLMEFMAKHVDMDALAANKQDIKHEHSAQDTIRQLMEGRNRIIAMRDVDEEQGLRVVGGSDAEG